MVGDLGSSFGSPELNWKRKGSLKDYSASKMILRATPSSVDFSVPGRPTLNTFVNMPEYRRRLELLWIGQGIPIADVRWLAGLLTQLSRDQLRDAFRAGDYSSDEVEGFVNALESRIEKLQMQPTR
jgi:hypothetical protein